MKLLALIFLFSCLIYPQEMNPDGYIGYPSFHFTPHWSFGESELIGTFDNRIYENQNFKGEYIYGGNLNFDFLAKLPISKALTLSAFYSTNPLKNKYNEWGYRQELTGIMHDLGLTISFYLR